MYDEEVAAKEMPIRSGGVIEQIGALNHFMDDLDKALTVLNLRLMPVLVEEQEKDNMVSKMSPPPPVSSGLANELRTVQQRIDSAARRVNSIIERIDF